MLMLQSACSFSITALDWNTFLDSWRVCLVQGTHHIQRPGIDLSDVTWSRLSVLIACSHARSHARRTHGSGSALRVFDGCEGDDGTQQVQRERSARLLAGLACNVCDES